MSPKGEYRVGVAGATGAVGSTILEVLAEREFPASEVRPLASSRSAGSQVAFAGAALEVQEMTDESIQGLDLILSSAGGTVSSEWAPKWIEAGAVVVDNTSYWRMHEDVPLVVADVNDDAVEGHSGLIANPNCTTMQMMVALKPIVDAAGIERLIVSTYQSVSGTGRKAIEELREQAKAVLDGKAVEAEVYPHQVAFNVFPQAETFKDGDDYTTEERKVMAETRKILGLSEDVGISATCARVPVFTGHSESVNVQTAKELSPEECRELLSDAPGLVLLDDPADAIYPVPIAAAGPRRGPGRKDPPRSLARALPQPLGGGRQPPQGRGDQRRPGRRAAARAGPRPGPGRRQPELSERLGAPRRGVASLLCISPAWTSASAPRCSSPEGCSRSRRRSPASCGGPSSRSRSSRSPPA